MASESDSGVLGECAPNVDIQVTTDVCLTKTNFEPSGNSEGTKITIVTDLNAVIKEKSRQANKYDSEHHHGESSIDYADDLNILDESFNQPVVRRSKKCTHLNIIKNAKLFKESEKFEISRTILLPYLGCTSRNETVKKDIKSSKSWENIKDPNENATNVGLLRCKSLDKTSSFFNYPYKKSQNFKGRDLSFHPSDNFDITYSRCGSDLLLPSPRSYLQGIPTSNVDNDKLREYMEESMKKCAAYDKNDDFDKEIYIPQAVSYPVKATRNVSILHRPRTREKATSTTSLNIENNLKQSLQNSIKGMLLPYLGPGKEFPSEIVLQLATKKEIIESKKDKGNLIGVMRFDSNCSGDDLLLPVTSSKNQKKKNKWNIFDKLLPKSKSQKSKNVNTNNNCDDWEGYDKEVYYPSIVEVHTKKKTKICEF